MPNIEAQEAATLRHAVQAGIIDNPINDILGGMWPNEWAIPANIIDMVAGSPALIQDPNQFELYEHPASKRLQESTFGPQERDATVGSYNAIELARICVPDGHVGFLKSIEQVLYDREGSIYPSSNEYWGSPYFIDTDIANERWYFTLDYYDGTQPEPFFLLSTTPPTLEHLPGMPYPDLNTIDGMWYPAHCSNTNDLNLVIPSSRMLRFFWVTQPQQNLKYWWVGAGRLRAFVQSTYHNNSVDNSRRVGG